MSQIADKRINAMTLGGNYIPPKDGLSDEQRRIIAGRLAGIKADQIISDKGLREVSLWEKPLYWLEEKIIGYDRENAENIEADIIHREITHDAKWASCGDPEVYQNYIDHRTANKGEDGVPILMYMQDLGKAYGETMQDTALKAASITKGGLNATLKTIIAAIPWWLWVGLGIYGLIQIALVLRILSK